MINVAVDARHRCISFKTKTCVPTEIQGQKNWSRETPYFSALFLFRVALCQKPKKFYGLRQND